MTRVVNIRRLHARWESEEDHVYIGRAGKGLSGYFGNPLEIGRDGNREEVLVKYRSYLENRISTDPEFRQRVKELSGKVLVCFCKPKPCHGDVLAEFADRLTTLQE